MKEWNKVAGLIDDGLINFNFHIENLGFMWQFDHILLLDCASQKRLLLISISKRFLIS